MYHYITVPGHPSDNDLGYYQKSPLVPLHYSSGASIRHHINNQGLNNAVPLHYSSGASIRQCIIWIINSNCTYHYITVPGHPSDSEFEIFTTSCKVPLHYSSGASIRPWTTVSRRNTVKYHYITVPGHPSDWKEMKEERLLSTITLQFRGIHPTISKRSVVKIMMYHYITVPGHPSDKTTDCFRSRHVPLHYSSGASIRPVEMALNKLWMCTITLQFRGIHPTHRCKICFKNFWYHYITVPGHPSDLCEW